VGEPSLFVLTAGIPVVVVLFLVYISGWSFPTGPVKYSAHHLNPRDGFIWVRAIQVVFSLAMLFAVVSLVLSLKSYWNALERNGAAQVGGPRKPFVPSLIEALKEILPHTTFKDCEANNIRYASHLLVFWGMIGLFITTGLVFLQVDILGEIFGMKELMKPPSMNGPNAIPIKILGNVSAIAFVLGLGIMLVRRLTAPEQAGKSSYFDWFFLFVICGAGVTGLLTELSRWGGSIGGAYGLYTVHLMFVLALLLYLPFSKFAHLGYRTVAIAWGKSAGRNMTIPVAPNYVPPAPAEASEAKSEGAA
jgi:quinone-modifying oxidoreductase subunit QmoC